MSRSDLSRKTSDVEERNAVQCGTIDAHRRSFTGCNGQSRVGALQYHKATRRAIWVADRAIGSTENRPDVVGAATANLAFFAPAGAFWRAAHAAKKRGKIKAAH